MIVADVGIDHAADGGRELGGLRGRGETREVPGQCLAPFHSDLPSAAFVSEEDDVFTFVEPAQEIEDQLERVARLSQAALGTRGHASREEALGTPRSTRACPASAACSSWS